MDSEIFILDNSAKMFDKRYDIKLLFTKEMTNSDKNKTKLNSVLEESKTKLTNKFKINKTIDKVKLYIGHKKNIFVSK